MRANVRMHFSLFGICSRLRFALAAPVVEYVNMLIRVCVIMSNYQYRMLYIYKDYRRETNTYARSMGMPAHRISAIRWINDELTTKCRLTNNGKKEKKKTEKILFLGRRGIAFEHILMLTLYAWSNWIPVACINWISSMASARKTRRIGQISQSNHPPVIYIWLIAACVYVCVCARSMHAVADSLILYFSVKHKCWIYTHIYLQTISHEWNTRLIKIFN